MPRFVSVSIIDSLNNQGYKSKLIWSYTAEHRWTMRIYWKKLSNKNFHVMRDLDKYYPEGSPEYIAWTKQAIAEFQQALQKGKENEYGNQPTD